MVELQYLMFNLIRHNLSVIQNYKSLKNVCDRYMYVHVGMCKVYIVE